MKKQTILTFAVFITMFASAQLTKRHEVAIPDILGYHTLKCDFHTHTVFSDGEVWPSTRVIEAWLDGLDAIAITDHAEYTPHKEILLNRNRSYEIASEKANKLNMILIKGTEITRLYPCGHVNTLFTTENEILNQKDSMVAFVEAQKQKAIFQWNHPGWRRPGQIPEWTSTQSAMYDNGMMNMIEIVNENDYYPLAHKLALEKNLAISANSDIHPPIYLQYGKTLHRPMTMVFAQERTLESIKEAILDRRTAVYFGDTLVGNEKFLKAIFEKSLKVKTPKIHIIGTKGIALLLENASDVPMMLTFTGGSDDFANVSSGVYIAPRSTVNVTIKGLKENFKGERNYSIQCQVNNYWIAPAIKLKTLIDFAILFDKKSDK
jgi:hypothetical protein